MGHVALCLCSLKKIDMYETTFIKLILAIATSLFVGMLLGALYYYFKSKYEVEQAEHDLDVMQKQLEHYRKAVEKFQKHYKKIWKN
jgi:uncharacterized membrane-anchored protein YhcB (DUF1043 family)